MYYHAALLLREPIGSTRDILIDEEAPDLGADAKAVAPVRGKVRFMRTGRGVLASAALATRVQVTCGRCLGEALTDVEFTFDEEFRPTVDVTTGLPVPAPDPDEEWSLIDEHHIIDLTDVIRQNILVSLPMKPLCDEACPGLCARCGQRLDGTCTCESIAAPGAQEEGPLAAALRDWLAKQGE